MARDEMVKQITREKSKFGDKPPTIWSFWLGYTKSLFRFRFEMHEKIKAVKLVTHKKCLSVEKYTWKIDLDL